MQKKSGLGLLLAGVAAYGLYKYSKMSANEKDDLKVKLKNQGKKIYDDYVPKEVKDVFAKKETENSSPTY